MNNSGVSQGISTSGALLIVFIVLKLVDVIDWSWWWVLSPLWIPFSLTLVIGLPILFFIVVHTKEKKSAWKNLPYD